MSAAPGRPEEAWCSAAAISRALVVLAARSIAFAIPLKEATSVVFLSSIASSIFKIIGGAGDHNDNDDNDNDDDQEGDADAKSAADTAGAETGLGGLSSLVTR